MKTLAALAIVAVLAVWFARRPAMIEPLPNAADGAGTEPPSATVAAAPASNGCPPGHVIYHGIADQYPFCDTAGSGTVPSAMGGTEAWQAAYFPASGGSPVVSDVMHGHGWTNGSPPTWPVAPVDGDVWRTTRGVFCRVNGYTIGPTTAAACGITKINALTAGTNDE